MRLLLDTHLLVWIMGSPRKVPQHIIRLLVNSKNQVFYSAASIIEVAAKRASGRRGAPDVAADRLVELAAEAGYQALAIAPAHGAAIETLATSHGDPFDRILLAQARAEDMHLVTRDQRLAAYDSRTILF